MSALTSDDRTSESEAWTIGRLLQWTADYLQQHGSDSPRLEAEVLLAHVRGCPRIELYTSFTDEATPVVRQAYRELVRRRAEGTPVAYLVGSREFYSLPFRVTPDVLIPRPETELVVMRLIDLLKQSSTVEPPLVADVGTGSGIIAIAAARHNPHARFVAIDVSSTALEVARDNAARLRVADRIEFVVGDLFAAVDGNRRFNFIASNPPYVSTAEMAALPSAVRLHEPSLALAAGPAGTDVIRRLIPQAAERLLPEGSLLLEISPMIESQVLSLIESETRFEAATTLKDPAGLARVVETRRKHRQPSDQHG